MIRAVFFAVVLCVATFQATANPFLGSEDSSVPAPVAVSGGAGPFVELQLAFRDQVGSALSSFKEHPHPATVIAVLLGAFLYGMFHAAGPGHRKTVLFSLFLARKAKWWEPLAAGFLSAGVHAAAGITLVAIFSIASGAIATLAKVDGTGMYMEGFTFAALGIVALFLAVKTMLELVSRKPHRHGKGRDAMADPDTRSNRNVLGGRLYAVAALASLVPCPGATMVLLFALYLGLVSLGILSVIAMSFGMALVISAAGYLAYFGRAGIFLKLKGKGDKIGLIAHILELASYLFMLIFALYAAWPFLVSLAKS